MLEFGLRIDPIISHHFPFDDFERAFEALHTGEASKVILDIA